MGLAYAIGFAAAAQASGIDTFVKTDVPGGSAWIDGTAGSFNGNIHWAGNPGGEGAAIGRIRLVGTDASNVAQSIPVYCVDVADWLGNGTFTKRDLSTLSFTAAQRSAIVQFITFGDAQIEAATGYARTQYSAATQLGLWEILNENAGEWNLLSGSFWVSSYDSNDILDAAATANTWLTSLKARTMPTHATESLGVLDPGPGNQTQVYIKVNDTGQIPPAVPEPATWGMMAIGFGALGFGLRRSRESALLT